MRECKAFCPQCRKPLVYCPELKHNPSDRPVFKCGNADCLMAKKKKGQTVYMVLGNKDNFGDSVETSKQKRRKGGDCHVRHKKSGD